MKTGWQRKKLADVLKIQNGYAFDSKNFNSSKGMPLVRIRSLKLGIEAETFFDGPYDDKYVVKAGDLLIGMDGEFGCYEWKGEPSLLNQRVCRLQDFTGQLIPKFLFYGVNDYLKAIEDVTGFTTVKHLSSKQILDIDFPVPPLPEQHRIVAILDEAFDGIATARANAEKNLHNARALFESHLQKVFTQRGEEWIEKRLGDVFTTATGTTPPKSNADFYGDFIPLVKPPELCNELIDSASDGLSEDGAAVARLLPQKSILVSCIGNLGKVGLNTVPVAFNQQINAILPDESHAIPEFMFFQTLAPVFKEQLESLASGTTVPIVNKSKFNSVGVVLPPLPIQRSVAAQFSLLREETQRLESLYQRKLAALDALKQSLLHQAFSGAL